MSGKGIRTIKTTQNAMERAILSMEKQDHIKISVIKEALKDNINLLRYLRKQKMEVSGLCGMVERRAVDT